MLFLISFCLFLSILYYFLTRKNNYWKDKNIPYLKPVPILGNYSDLILQKKTFGQTLQEICKKFPDAPVVGAFFGSDPVLIPQDPDIIKLIMTKDFYYFHGREITEHVHKEPLLLNLFANYGDQWKVMRQNITPLFSSAKMKTMFNLIAKCSHSLEQLLDREAGISQTIDVVKLIQRYTIENIGACIFGVDANLMAQLEGNPFNTVANDFTEISKFLAFKDIAKSIWPKLFYGLGLKVVTNEIDVFTKIVNAIFNQRNNKPSARNDFMDFILKWKDNKHIVGDSIENTKTGEEKKVVVEASDDLLIAQSVILFSAGFETSSVTSTFTLYELAKNVDIQNKVCEEVDEFLKRHKNKIEYECISELPYLEACVNEAMRLYPVLGAITREVMENYTLPSGLCLKRGLRIHIPIYHMHHNAKYYPNVEEFCPERFYGEEKRNIVQYTYMPFGEGPRLCIGMRFARMQLMAGLVTILKKYKVELAEGMPRNIELRPEAFVIQPKTPIRLKFVEREGWENRVYDFENCN